MQKFVPLAGAAFVGLFLGRLLGWWLALPAIAAAYGAASLLIQRNRPSGEIAHDRPGSAADISASDETLQDAQHRLERAANRVPDEDAVEISEMAAHVGSIRRSVTDGPEFYRPARRFILFCLPDIVRTVENYARLAGQMRGDRAARLHDLSGQIRNLGRVLERIDAACVENDLRALEIEVDVLSRQLDGA